MNAVINARRKSVWQVYFHLRAIPFWGVHLAALIGTIWVGFSWTGILWTAGVYLVGMFLVTGVYHRYFAHRSYKTSRPVQFLLALLATATSQKGVLWWAHHHRAHHRNSDQPNDIHSPRQSGFWWAHLGWILGDDFQGTRYEKIRDFARYPELVWLNEHQTLVPLATGLVIYLVGGVTALVWGYLLGIVLLWHGTFTINSLSHVFGWRRFDTTDTSRNNPLLAMITLGEGWHNNHHHYQASCNQGFRWYEVDVTYYIIRAMALVGLVWDVKTAPRHVVENRPSDKTLALRTRTEAVEETVSLDRAA